jgi:hypothetical protein
MAIAVAWIVSSPAHAAAPRQVIPLDGAWEVEQGGMDAAPAAFTHKIAAPSLMDMAEPAFSDVGPRSGQRAAFWHRRTFKVDGPVPAVAVLKVSKATFGAHAIRDGKTVTEKSLPCEIPALGIKMPSFSMEIPKDPAQHKAEAALVKPGADRVRSRREFKVVAGQ